MGITGLIARIPQVIVTQQSILSARKLKSSCWIARGSRYDVVLSTIVLIMAPDTDKGDDSMPSHKKK